MEPIEPGSTPPQGPETVEIPENWPGLWADLASVKALADMAMGHPQTSRLAMATAALCQVTENLAQRIEALESPKPCEGCADQAKAIGEMLEEFAKHLPMNTERERGLLARGLRALGWKGGN